MKPPPPVKTAGYNTSHTTRTPPSADLLRQDGTSAGSTTYPSPRDRPPGRLTLAGRHLGGLPDLGLEQTLHRELPTAVRELPGRRAAVVAEHQAVAEALVADPLRRRVWTRRHWRPRWGDGAD